MPPTRQSRSTPRREAISRLFLAGYIAWLPSKNKDDPEDGINHGYYNHPIIILSPFPRDGKVVFLTVSRNIKNSPRFLFASTNRIKVDKLWRS